MSEKDPKQVAGKDERVEPTPKEVAKPTSGGKQEQPTSPEPKDLPSGKTYTQEEYSTAQSAWQKRANEAESEVRKALGEANEAQKRADNFKETLQTAEAKSEVLLARVQELEDEGVKDDPEGQALLKRLRQDLKASEQKVLELDKKAKGLDEREEKLGAEYWKLAANDLSKKTGAPVEDLLKADNIYDMKIKAQDFELAEVKKKPTEPKVDIPTPDKSVSTGGSAMPDSAHGKIKAGWDDLHKP